MKRKLSNNLHAVIDISVVLMIGIAFVGLIVMGYIIWQIDDQMGDHLSGRGVANWSYANTSANITGGFDNAINFLLVAITIVILAIAIAALLMLRGRR